MASNSSWVDHFIAGAMAGYSTSFITCPLDVVKTRLQSQLPNTIMGQYQGTLPTLRRIWREEGLRGLYRGLTPTLIGYLPGLAIYFPLYATSKQWLLNGYKLPPSVCHLLAAMMAGGAGALLLNPLWVIRVRMINANYEQSILAWGREILAKDGVRAFYRGVGPSLLGVSHVCVQFPLYEHFKMRLQGDKDKAQPLDILLASTASKLVASSVTYPHEVIRTRLQNQSTANLRYRGLVHAIERIGREEGWRGFYRGLPTNVMRVIPASAVTFLTYELSLQWLTSEINEADYNTPGRGTLALSATFNGNYPSHPPLIHPSSCRPSTLRRSALSASTVLVMVPPCVSKSRRWKLLNMPSILAVSVER